MLKEKEIVLKSFNSVNKSTLSTFLFSWEDIKPVREEITKKEVIAIAVINDFDKEVRLEYLEALKAKNADFMLWSNREINESISKVAA